MLTRCYSIYDSKAKVFSTPFFAVNDLVALRSFMAAANDPALQICRHAEDFTLFFVGEFNDELGELRPALQLGNLGLASIFKGVIRNEDAPQSVSDEALVFAGAPGGNSSKHVRP